MVSVRHNQVRIVVFAPFTKPINMGGGSNALSFVSYLRSLGTSAILICKTDRGRLVQVNRQEGSLKLWWPDSLIFKAISLMWFMPICLYHCARSTHVFFTGIHFPATWLLMFSCKIMQKHIVFRSTLWGDDDPLSLKNRGIMGWPLKIAIGKADTYHAINPKMTLAYRAAYGSDKKVIETVQGVNTSEFNLTSRKNRERLCHKYNINPAHRIICTVGFVIGRKGFPEIFDIVEGLRGNYTYIVVGDLEFSKTHPLRRFRKEVSENIRTGNERLAGKVIFLGSTGNVAEIYSISDILLMNSIQEGTPNVVLEAMACGAVPVIRQIEKVTDFAVTHGLNGFLFDNKVEARHYIQMLIDNPLLARAFSENAADFASEHFSFDRVWERLQKKMGLPVTT